jgi:hypothetical protein
MIVECFTDTEFAVLNALGTYRFLTPTQMCRIGVTKAKPHLHQTLARLRAQKPAPIKMLDFGRLPGVGRLSTVYFLTPYGGDLLSEARREAVETPQHVRYFRHDYFHRLYCVDVHIILSLWVEASGGRINFFHTYFERKKKGASGFYPQTRIALSDGILVPDIIMSFSTKDDIKRLCALELWTGRNTADIADRQFAYFKALREEAIERAYDYLHGVRILNIFVEERGLELVRNRVGDRLAELAPCYFLKTLESLENDPAAGWQQFDQPGTVPLFQDVRADDCVGV